MALKSAHVIPDRCGGFYSRQAASLACFDRPSLYQLCQSDNVESVLVGMHAEGWATHLMGQEHPYVFATAIMGDKHIGSGVSDEANT